MKKFIFLLLSLTLIIGCSKYRKPDSVSTTLNGIKIATWMYQIQYLDENSAIDYLDDTEYDMMVVEPGFNFVEEPYDTPYLTSSLKQKPNGDERLLLAYIDIGQAEDYRTYWQSDWIAPTSTQVGSPDFLVTIDPDGWSGNYPVAYWDPLWKELWLGENGMIQQIVDYGFDGVYLDWVEAYDDEKVIAAANSVGKNAAEEMMIFIEEIKDFGRSINSDFLVVSQNAPYLLDENVSYYSSIIDALAVEDTWYYGEGDVDWSSSQAGDLEGGDRHDDEYSTENRIKQSKKYLDNGIPVFTVDYCISKRKANRTYKKSRKNGFIPLVTRVSLSEITETEPF